MSRMKQLVRKCSDLLSVLAGESQASIDTQKYLHSSIQEGEISSLASSASIMQVEEAIYQRYLLEHPNATWLQRRLERMRIAWNHLSLLRFIVNVEDAWQAGAHNFGIVTNMSYGIICAAMTIGSAVVHPLKLLGHFYLTLAILFACAQLIESLISTAAAFPQKADTDQKGKAKRSKTKPPPRRPFQSEVPAFLAKRWPFLVDLCMPIVTPSVLAAACAQAMWKFTTTYLLLQAAHLHLFLAGIIAGSYASLSAIANLLNDFRNAKRARGQPPKGKTDESINYFGKRCKVGTGFCSVGVTFFSLIVNHAPLGVNLLFVLFQLIERVIYCTSTFASDNQESFHKEVEKWLHHDKVAYYRLTDHRLIYAYKAIAAPTVLVAGAAQAISRYTITVLLVHELGFHANAHALGLAVGILAFLSTIVFDRKHVKTTEHILVKKIRQAEIEEQQSSILEATCVPAQGTVIPRQAPEPGSGSPETTDSNQSKRSQTIPRLMLFGKRPLGLASTLTLNEPPSPGPRRLQSGTWTTPP